ncbi:hypothetical protein C8Q76DRAFT_738252 [Earliella scabrosa]|nr:hypothetical protein C8Q76DRAFT_738252 [Earliella scabrosa]
MRKCTYLEMGSYCQNGDGRRQVSTLNGGAVVSSSLPLVHVACGRRPTPSPSPTMLHPVHGRRPEAG